MAAEKLIPLGKTDIKISHIGLGTMQWGDVRLSSQTGIPIKDAVKKIFQISLDHGINFFDTAEAYGACRSEINLNECIKSADVPIVVASKFMPYPWRLTRGELRKALQNSLQRLGLTRLDLYQMHWPFPPVPITSWMEEMADLFADGLIHAVGISNYSVTQTTLAYETLAKHAIPLASNQVKYSLLDRRVEENGLLELSRKLGFTIIAYSPLEKGVLTGKFNPDNLPSGIRSWRYNRSFQVKIKPIIEVLREIGSNHNGKTPGQVALNWLVEKGAVPIPGAKNSGQAEENASALDWQLCGEEVTYLDRISNETFQ